MVEEQRIGAYLRPEEKKAFYAYAAALHVRPATLASLLLVRELRRKRLTELSVRYDSLKNGRGRVTSQKDPALKKAFEQHVSRLNMRPDPAATILFRAELDEHWLRASMATDAMESG